MAQSQSKSGHSYEQWSQTCVNFPFFFLGIKIIHNTFLIHFIVAHVGLVMQHYMIHCYYYL